MIPTPERAARRVATELVAIAAVEVTVLAVLAALGAAGASTSIGIALGAASLVGIARALVAAQLVRGQRVLHRAAVAQGEERFVPSARIVELAHRRPFAIAGAGPSLLFVLLAPVSLRLALLGAAVAMLAVPAIESRVRRVIDAWLAAIPDEDVPERPPRAEALVHAALAAAPALALALFVLALAPPSGAPIAALALVPVAGVALAGWRAVGRARSELAVVAESIARMDPGDLEQAPRSLVTADARRAHLEALSIARAAADAARADADAQSEIEREEEVRSRFMAAMGHELRSPLNSIVGFAQLLEDGTDGPLDPPLKESVVLIRRSAEDLLRLLTDILDSARLDAQHLRLTKAWTPSVEIVTEAVRIGRSIVEGQSVTIESQVQPGLPPVMVDRERIVQAVVATFRHAVRSASGRTIEVRARVGPDPSRRRALLVEVRDAQRTLSRDDLERIFDAFRGLRDVSTGRRIGGLGLALSLARKLVRLHGGDVWAESSAGSGTRYVVALPLDG